MLNLTRRDFNRGVLATGGTLLLSRKRTTAGRNDTPTFVHPGMLHGASDIERMKQAVGARQQPIYAGFERLRDDPHSQLSYRMRGPFAEAGRLPTVHIQEFDSDSGAAYQCALMWAITEDVHYAAISRSILNAWAGTLKAITGVDAILACGLGGFLYLNAAEILRSTGQASDGEITSWKHMFLEVFLPVIAEFAPFANGNWDTAALKTLMAIAIFCDEAALFDHAVQYYLYGCGDGRLRNYIYANGQCQESGRDQAHTQLGLGHMGDCCEVAWHQGLDLYGQESNRLLLGFEYTSRYAMGDEVPFTPDIDRTGKYLHTVISVRHPKVQPIFEQIYNHYVNRMGTPAPETERIVLKERPEGSDISAHPGFGTLTFSDPKAASADHPGFGTLTYSRSKVTGATPSLGSAAVFGVRALGSHDSVQLQWLPLHGRETYAVQRAGASQGPFATIESHLSAATWTDRTVSPGRTYFYRIARESGGLPSLVAGATAGLPQGWQQHTLGTDHPAGTAFFNGDAFILETGGIRHGHSFEGGLSVSRRWGSASTMTARLVPRIASQRLAVGMMVKGVGDADTIRFYLSPDAAGIDEHPKWAVCLRTVTAADAIPDQAPTLALASPVLLNGRVLGELWFRLQRSDKMLSGAISSDGRTWQSVGETRAVWLSDDSDVGLLLNSGLGEVTTEVILDHVVLT